jgi:lambda repressor-like predicted transcriptional regulator
VSLPQEATLEANEETDPIEVWTARYNAEKEKAMAEILAMSPEELAAAASRYPTDNGGFTRNPYMD